MKNILFRTLFALIFGFFVSPMAFAGGAGSMNFYDAWQSAQQTAPSNSYKAPQSTNTTPNNRLNTINSVSNAEKSFYEFANQYAATNRNSNAYHVVFQPISFSTESNNQVVMKNTSETPSNVVFQEPNNTTAPSGGYRDYIVDVQASNTGNPSVIRNVTNVSANTFVDEFPSATNTHQTRNSIRRVITDSQYDNWYTNLFKSGEYLNRNVSYYENYTLREQARQVLAQNRAARLRQAYSNR